MTLFIALEDEFQRNMPPEEVRASSQSRTLSTSWTRKTARTTHDMSRRRVVITGAGVVSSMGIGVDEFWRNCLDGKSNVSAIPGHWEQYAELHSRNWSPLPDIDPEALGVAPDRDGYSSTRSPCLPSAPRARPLGAPGSLLHRPASVHVHFYLVRQSIVREAGVFFGTGLGGAITFLQNHTHHLLRKPRADLVGLCRKA